MMPLVTLGQISLMQRSETHITGLICASTSRKLTFLPAQIFSVMNLGQTNILVLCIPYRYLINVEISLQLISSAHYCYKFFSSFTTCRTCFYLLFFIYDRHAFTTRQTCLSLMFISLSTLCFTCVCLKANTFLYLFKPVVRQLYSLAFH